MATPEEQLQSMLRNLEEKTRNPLKPWLSVVKEPRLDNHGAFVKLLKANHGIPTATPTWWHTRRCNQRRAIPVRQISWRRSSPARKPCAPSTTASPKRYGALDLPRRVGRELLFLQ